MLDGYRNKSRLVFSDREIARLFSYIKANGKLTLDARVVMILIFTGLRPEDLFSVRKEDVHFGDKYFVAKGSKTEAGRDRLIPIVPITAPFKIRYLGVYIASICLIRTFFEVVFPKSNVLHLVRPYFAALQSNK